MYELLVKKGALSEKEKHIAICGEDTIARLFNSTKSQSFKFDNRAYEVVFESGQPIEFVQSPRFTINSIIYNIYQNDGCLGTISRKALKSDYEVGIDEGSFVIELGWMLKRDVEYTNHLGNQITIEKRISTLANWKVHSESEITQFDISIILFLRAMSELIQ